MHPRLNSRSGVGVCGGRALGIELGGVTKRAGLSMGCLGAAAGRALCPLSSLPGLQDGGTWL